MDEYKPASLQFTGCLLLMAFPLVIGGVIRIIYGPGRAWGLGLLVLAGIALFIRHVIREDAKDQTPLSLFGSGQDPLETAVQAVDSGSQEAFIAASLHLMEAVEQATRMTSAELEDFEKVRADIAAAPSPEAALNMLRNYADSSLKMANPQLNPIAFAVRPTTASQYVTGIVRELFIWLLVVLSAPVLILVGSLSSFVASHAGKGILYWALRASRDARRYRVQPHNILQRRHEAPILYLRAFSEELPHRDTYFPSTPEEGLAKHYNAYGPTIAIGLPEEELPLLGALRIYFDNSIWQAGVIYLMSVSQKVVIQAGVAPGLLWELGVAKRVVDPRRVSISFAAWKDLPLGPRHLNYVRFKKYAQLLLNCELPSESLALTNIEFDENWKPKVNSDTSPT